MTNKTHNIFHIVTVLAIIALSLCLWRSCTKPLPEPTIVTKTDTIREIKIDTQFVAKPKYISRVVLDTVYVPKDTVLYVEQKTYSDSVATIWVSGVNPIIDSAKYTLPKEYITINTTTTNTIVKEKHWSQFVGIGVGTGYGVSMTPQPQFSPYVGVSITYGFGYTW